MKINKNIGLTIAMLSVVAVANASNYKQHRVWKIDATATTGVNDLCGVAIWDFPLHFTFLGEYNSAVNATDALPLEPSDCAVNNLILATTTDPMFQAASGAPEDASSFNKNVPLNKVATITGGDGSRSRVPFRSDVPLSPTVVNALSPEPITMGKWLRGKGSARLICRKNGSATFTARFKHLIPNGLYTMWEIWGTVTETGGTGLAAVPLGGVPNVFTANNRGIASYTRTLSGCPKTEMTSDGAVMRFIDVVYHSDGTVAAGVPGLGGSIASFTNVDGETYQSTLPVGTISHTHLVFPLNVERL